VASAGILANPSSVSGNIKEFIVNSITYENIIDAIILNSASCNVQTPEGLFKPFDILRKMWFKIQIERPIELPTVAMQRQMFLKPCRINQHGSIQVQMDKTWMDTGFILVKPEYNIPDGRV
jgi:hypothetical protein